MTKRPLPDSGASGDKRQRLSSDASEIGETKESDALPVIPLPVITKEDGAADRKRQGYAKSAESQSPPCIAILYNFINGKRIGGKWVKSRYVPTGESIPFTSRVKAGECFGGMNRNTVVCNIFRGSKTKINGGDYEGQYVSFSNKTVESIMVDKNEIKPAPTLRSKRVKGHKYVFNDIVRIWGGNHWKCVEHNKALTQCVECGGACLCPCEIQRYQCLIHRVQPLLECIECQTTWPSASALDRHMRTHTGEKPHPCYHNACSFRSATKSDLK